MGKFSKIKKYNLNSLSIDEKIKFLDKEMEKTGLNEQPANSTSSVYSQKETQPNTAHTNFTSSSFNNLPLGFSGHDGSGVGGAYVGKVIASEHGLSPGIPSHDAILNLDGVAVSPPHPVSGRRVYASTRTGMVTFSPTQPGKVQGNLTDALPTGSVMWIWNPTANNSDGTSGAWYPLEFDVATQAWGFWDSNFLGFGFLNTDLSQLEFTPGDSTGTALNTLLTNNGLNNQDMGQPSTIVLNTKSLESADNLPIDVAKKFIAGMLDLAGEGFNFLRDRATSGALDTALDLIANITGTSAEKDNVDDYMRNFIPDLFAGLEPIGSTSDNPRDNSKVYDAETISDYEEIFKDYQKEINGEKGTLDNSWETNYSLKQRDNNSIGNTTGTLDPSAGDGFIDNGDGTVTLRKAFDFDRYDDMAGSNLATTLGAMTYGIMSGIPGLLIKSGGKTPTMYTGITFDKKTGKVIPNYKRKSIKESLDESVKLGHFDPEALTVDIEDIRKGIMPEFPKKPPAEMIDGYSVKSKLAPKVIKGEPTIKVRKKDLAALHILKDSEIKELLQQIDLINDYLQKNPADLIYAQQRYPKNDIRLAQLNWKMDQMLDAGEEYLDTQFPENQRLVDRIKKATKKTMELTNPEAYKNLNKPDMELMSLDDHMKEKRVVSRHFKKKRQSKSMFRVDMEKVKEKNRKVAEQKVAEWQEKRRIELLNSNEFDELKSDWRKELGEGMTTSDTFSYSVSGKGDVDLTTTGTGYSADGVHQLQNIEPMTNVSDPTNAGKKFSRTHGLGSRTYGAINQYDSQADADAGIESHYWNEPVTGPLLDDNTNIRLSDYVWPFDRDATGAETDIAKAASKVRGKNDSFRAVYPTNTIYNQGHKTTPVVTNPTVGTNDDYATAGLGVQFGHGADTRDPKFFVPNPVNTSEIDTVQILASLPSANSVTSAGSQLQLFYWSGDKPGFQSLYPAQGGSYPFTKNQNDGWRPIAMKPSGETDSSVNSNLIDIEKPADYLGHGVINKFSVQLPEWCRSTSTRFMFVQLTQNGSMDRLVIYKIGYQRRNALTINTTLADEKASAFVRVGNNSQMTPEERKKKLNDMLKASREYMLKSLGFASLFNDEVKISDVVSNTFDYEAVMQGSGAFGNSRFNDLVSLEKRQAQAKKYRARPKTRKRSGRFRGYQRTGRDSKGMTTRARVNPKDIIGSI